MSKYFQNDSGADFLSDYDNIPSVEGVPDGVCGRQFRADLLHGAKMLLLPPHNDTGEPCI